MPKELPLRGEDLMPGYQYELDPAARRVIADVFGINNVPTYVECIRKRVAGCRRTSITENLETGEVHTSVITEPEQLAAFRAHMGNTKLVIFTLDLPSLQAARAALTPAELVKEDRFTQTDERPASRRSKPTRLRLDINTFFLPEL
jgi:hypothetical protein